MKMKPRVKIVKACFVGAGILAVATISVEQKTLAAPPPTDPAHAAHVASGAMPPEAATSDPTLLQLKEKVAQLEATLAKSAPPAANAAVPAVAAMPGMATSPAAPMAGMKSGAPIAASPMAPTGGMSGMASPPAGPANMMGMMEKMMGMMDKMMSMEGGAMPAGATMAGGGGMGMGMMQKEMAGMGGGAMPSGAPPTAMSGGGMSMDKMEMSGMMGMGSMSSGPAGTTPQSALPGFPGASHLYHIGATGFFLDHPQHIALTTEQQGALNKAKEQAMLAKSSADRAIDQADQELWTLTAADQPDAAKIQAKIAEIEKLRGDERLSFIRAVGEASMLLTDEQRKILTGFASPAPTKSASGAAPAPMPMKDM